MQLKYSYIIFILNFLSISSCMPCTFHEVLELYCQNKAEKELAVRIHKLLFALPKEIEDKFVCSFFNELPIHAESLGKKSGSSPQEVEDFIKYTKSIIENDSKIIAKAGKDITIEEEDKEILSKVIVYLETLPDELKDILKNSIGILKGIHEANVVSIGGSELESSPSSTYSKDNVTDVHKSIVPFSSTLEGNLSSGQKDDDPSNKKERKSNETVDGLKEKEKEVNAKPFDLNRRSQVNPITKTKTFLSPLAAAEAQKRIDAWMASRH